MWGLLMENNWKLAANEKPDNDRIVLGFDGKVQDFVQYRKDYEEYRHISPWQYAVHCECQAEFDTDNVLYWKEMEANPV